MKRKDILTIMSLRDKGLTFAQIASRLDMSANTIKSICRRESEKKKNCRNCRQPLRQNKEGRPRSFCSDNCRILWWKKNDDKINRKMFYNLTCKNCDHKFDSYGHKERKYCRHSCYIADRFGVP